MLSAKNVCVLTESIFFLFCYNQEGALTSAQRDQEDQRALSLL